MPYCIFQDICTDIKLHGLHEERKKDASGSEAVSIELLVLGSLRLVGSGSSSMTSSRHVQQTKNLDIFLLCTRGLGSQAVVDRSTACTSFGISAPLDFPARAREKTSVQLLHLLKFLLPIPS